MHHPFKHPSGRPPPGGSGSRQPVPVSAVPQNPYFLQTPNPLHRSNFQNPATPFLPPQNYNHPSFRLYRPLQQNVFSPLNPCSVRQELLRRIEVAAKKVHNKSIDAGESTSGWNVSQLTLVELGVYSWGSLGFDINDIPFLHDLMVKEGKVDAFIHCFVAARKITTLHDLDVAICADEGIDQFEVLGMGPLLRHPLIVHYFSISVTTIDVCKIKTEEIFASLSKFISKFKPPLSLNSFLDYLMEEYTVSNKEKLGLRIQSFGLLVDNIRKAMKSERYAVFSSSEFSEHSYSDKERDVQKHQPHFTASEKEALDRRYDSISNRMKEFCASMTDLGNTHIRFDSSDNEGDENDANSHSQSPSQGKDSIQRVGNCPYPSNAEEMARLGLKGEKCSTSEKKRKRGNDPTPCMLDEFAKGVKARKYDIAFPSDLEDSFILNDSELRDFLSEWRDNCKEQTAVEFLNMVLNCSEKAPESNKRKRLLSMIEIFSSSAGIGLLNAAVAYVKSGMLEKYHANKSNAHDVETDIMSSACGNELINKTVTTADIVQKVSAYFISSYNVPNDTVCHLEKTFTMMKIIRDCETWLTTQFSVQEFSFLGCGDFFGFIEKNISLLPYEMHSFLIGNGYKKSLLMASMLPRQLDSLLSHTTGNFSDKEKITSHHISTLLDKQFPTISFQMLGNDLASFSMDIVKNKEDGQNSCSVLFSTTLLGNKFGRAEGSLSEVAEMASEVVQYDNFHRHSSEDAVKCLMKSPMLFDLHSWSHWDLVYGPSLGPLLEWLLSDVHCKDLLCIATRDGKFIRIDRNATAEEFLEAAIQGSSYEAAVKLLSLIPLYGGTRNVPVSLLKHFTRRAIEVVIRNSEECMDVTISSECFKPKRSFDGLGIELQNMRHSEFSAASCFILDCLSHLPSEFRSFAAEILVPGLQSFNKDAYSVLLHECKQTSQRLMLHDIGLSLGVVQWIDDLNAFKSLPSSDFVMISSQNIIKTSDFTFPESCLALKCEQDITDRSCNIKTITSSQGHTSLLGEHPHKRLKIQKDNVLTQKSLEDPENVVIKLDDSDVYDASLIIESIRRDEFGLEPNHDCTEDSLLKKQHARLGRALHCLSQELYSQDSHLLLELIQNADDNVYPENVDPALAFILQDNGIVILNNEHGFSAQNIRALCDIGNSTKKGGAGYIGHKGIGFKSVFRVTDAPEIHSNGFHVKFDISEGQIGFVLPTVISPYDISIHSGQLSCTDGQTNASSWKTCIVLPFQSKLKEETGRSSIISLFADLHPSLLLFLHRLKCIQYRNILNDTFIVMRKETLEDGIIRVYHGNEVMSWLVVKQMLQATLIRPDVQTTEIAIAFTLEECNIGEYKPYLSQQPVFAFLPLRQYGLKCILQGDFVLPSSREEVDGNSTWNQWLLSEFPKLFVAAEMSFCNLPCFKDCPGKAVSAFMKFVPLMGEVYGFFSHLPNVILSRLRISNCLLLEGHHMEWVPPCRVLRGWDDQAHLLITDSILDKYLGLGYLKKDIILSDSLARALGIKNYGPIILMDIMSSICNSDGAIECLGFNWLSSWLVAINILLTVQSTGYFPNEDSEFDIINNLKKIPFVPLSDGSYGSVAEGPIWLPFDTFSIGFESKHGPETFPHLYRKLRTVNVHLFSAEMSYIYSQDVTSTDNLIMILNRIGVQQLSAHEIIKNHIFPGLTYDFHKSEDPSIMIEYLSFAMLHQQFDCSSCCSEKEDFILELRKKPTILTNHGFKCPMMEPIHFSKEFQNPVSTDRLIDNVDSEWHEVDDIYLKHSCSQMLISGVAKWREFFLAMGVTDFVQVIQVENNASDLSNFSSIIRCNNEQSCSVSILSDWESPELARLLTKISLGNDKDKCKYMLEVLDSMWDDYYGARTTAHMTLGNVNDKRLIESSFMKIILNTKWVASSIDKELHLPKDVFLDCDSVRSILGAFAPYAIPQVTSKKFLEDIRFKAQVTVDDALSILLLWRMSDSPFKTSISQMFKFYNFIWDKLSSMEFGIRDQFKSSSCIFIPFIGKLRQKDAVPGLFLFPNDVYWHDPAGLMDQIEGIVAQSASDKSDIPCRELGNVYPSLHDFFVNECGVHDAPSFGNYVEILLQLSNLALPSRAASNVFRVLLKWADDLKAGIMKSEEVLNLKNSLSKLQNKVFPTTRDNWVSLHPTSGLICWSDDEELRIQFENSRNIHLLNFGILNDEDRSMLSGKLASFLQTIGVPSLSEVVSREAVSYGTEDNRDQALLVNWVLPYAQRYMYNLSMETYLLQKEVTLEKLRQLQVCVVKKLYYKHSLKGQSSNLKKKFKCPSLLQGNILYAAYSSDTHSIFLELSRVLFDGSANLHLANFLHMITTMAESGSNEDQIEFFIVNSQKICKLPPEESSWSLLSLRSKHDSALAHNHPPSIIPMEGNSRKVHKKTDTGSERPPVGWKSASGFGTGLTYKFKIPPSLASHCGSNMEKSIDEDWVVEDDDAAETAMAVQTIDGSNVSSSSAPYVGDNLSVNTSNEEECYRTGRVGEAAAFTYFGEKLNSTNLVNWVNKDVETGLPYDLIIGNNKDVEYIEVKTTKSNNKNWFEISSRELEFAFEKGDAFSIARVVLKGSNKAKITVFRNPLKLFRNKVLHLAILMS